MSKQIYDPFVNSYCLCKCTLRNFRSQSKTMTECLR